MVIVVGRRIIIAFLLLTSLALLSSNKASAQTSSPNLIILNSYHPGYTRSDNEIAGVLERLRQHYPDIVPAIEYPDAKRFIGEPSSFYAEYKPLVWGTVSFGSTLILVICILSINIIRRHKAEAALQESEARLHRAQEAAGTGSWDWNPRSGEVVWSPENYYLLGLTPDQGKASVELWLQCLHPDDRACVAVALDQALKEKEELDIEYRINRGDTGPRWLHSKGRIYRDDAGAVGRVIGTNLDITERRRAEEELRLKEKLLDSASDSIFLHDKEGNFLYLNEAAYKSRGYEKEELLGLNVLALPTPEFSRERARLLQELQVQGEIIFEAAHRRKDGSVMPVEIHARMLDLEDRQLILSVARDITERRRAEAALEESEAKYRTIVETALEGIWIIDAEGRVSYVNRRLAEMLDYTLDEMLGRDLFDFLDEADRESALEKVARRRQGIRETFDFRFRRRDGCFIWTIVAATPLLDPQGKFIGSLGMITNITERKLAQEAVQQSEELYRSLFENMLNGFAYCKMIFEQGQPQDFIYLEVNRAFETLTGLKDVVGKKVSEVIPGVRESSPELFEVYGRVALTGKPEKIETYMPALKMWLAISVYSLEKEYFVAVFEVITDRKQVEEALRTAAHKWRTTFDAMNDAVCLLDRDCQIIQANRAMATLAGKPLDEIIGHHCWEIMHGTETHIKGCPIKGMWQSRRRETLTLPQGDHWLHVMVDPILDEAGEVSGAVHIVTDITTRKRSQDRIRDLNILLRAIKNINETLLRAKSESELFQQICDLLVGVPYVRFVWIGLVQPGSFEVKPVAWAGDGDDYLSVIKVTWDDSEYGQGPTGAAIRTGKPVVRKSIETDPQPNPWREEGLKRGHKSSIALPLIQESEVVGVLKVYAGKEDAFKKEEIEFLTQVAGDIAVGVKSLRLEKDLQQSVSQLRDMMRQTVESIATISEIRDPYTAGHQRRVTGLACALAAQLGLDAHRIEGCQVTGFLHDIGKIGVPAEILSKPGKLNEYEMSIIRTHVQVGHDVLKNIDFPWPVAQIVLQHHERINGSGYPAGLIGPEMLLEAKILAVADVVEAMSSHRPYRPALGLDKALAEISKNKGILYDPEVVDACVNLFKDGTVKFD